MLEVADLHYRYGASEVLRGVALSVAAGEIVSMVGPNGAGKSTVLKCLNLILKPSAGQILFDGKPVAGYGRRERARLISYVPQQAGQAMSLPVVDMVGLGRAPHRGLDTAAHDRGVVLDVIEALGLQPLAMRLFGELSGGERQRVLIGRALAQEGRLMLLDEPTSDLDLHYQLETMTTLQHTARERGVGALIAIHDLALASRFSDRLIMLKHGAVYAAGPWPEVVTPANLEAVYGVGALIGEDSGLPYVIPTPIAPRL